MSSPIPTRALALVVLAVLPIAAIPSDAASPRTETRTYASGHFLGGCTLDDVASLPASPSSGSFDLDGSESSVTLTVADASGKPVNCDVIFFDGATRNIGSSHSCGGPLAAAVPTGVVEAVVDIADAAVAPFAYARPFPGGVATLAPSPPPSPEAPGRPPRPGAAKA